MNERKILIVEDDPAVAEVLRQLLARAEFTPVIAGSGEAGLQKLIEDKIDLVLLDVSLPGISGHEVCKRVRHARDGYIPIVMLTAKDQLSDKLLGMELGADIYLTKPFEPAELLAQIRALFRLIENNTEDRSHQHIAPLQAGYLQLIHHERRVTKSGVAVPLTPTEYDLLRYFMLHPNQAMGRETLLRAVWGYEFQGESRTVDTHVQRLRAKIELDDEDPRLIVSIRGFGYRFVVDI